MAHFGYAQFQWNDHNLLTYSEDFGQWSLSGTPQLTSGQTDPFGGTEAYLVEDDAGASKEYVYLSVDANTHNTSGSKAVLFFLKEGSSTSPGLDYYDLAGAATRLYVTVDWASSGPGFTFGNGSLLWHRPLNDGWWQIACLTAAGLTQGSSHELRFYPAIRNNADTGTVYCFGVQVTDVVTAGSYVATYGAAIAYSTESPSQSHSLQAPIRAARPSVDTHRSIRESLDRTHRNVVTFGDPRHGFVGAIRYESQQESFHDFLAAAQRFPVTYIPSTSDLNDAHMCWADIGDVVTADMDPDRGFPGFEDVSLEITLRRLDGQPTTGLYG